MKRYRIPLTLSLLLFAVSVSAAEEIAEDWKRQGYLFAAPGAFSGVDLVTLEVGGGYQWMTHGTFSLGFDGALMGLPDCFSCGGIVLGSLDAGYHFVEPSRPVAPFLLGGVGGVLTGEDSVPFVSFGGGLNYWLDNGTALRIEVRDRVFVEGIHSISVRLGVTF